MNWLVKLIVAILGMLGLSSLASGKKKAIVKKIDTKKKTIKKQVKVVDKKLKQVPITDKRMTRFWITLDQGVEFVLSSLDLMSGGEIYVPKIPSMKITDFINSFCPDKKLYEIGIRPGEKLHETMITKEDARNTYDCNDRYLIEPTALEWDQKRIKKKKIKGKKVLEDFEYTSNLNKQWLKKGELISLQKFF